MVRIDMVELWKTATTSPLDPGDSDTERPVLLRPPSTVLSSFLVPEFFFSLSTYLDNFFISNSFTTGILIIIIKHFFLFLIPLLICPSLNPHCFFFIVPIITLSEITPCSVPLLSSLLPALIQYCHYIALFP